MDRRGFLLLGATTLALAACTPESPEPDLPTPSTRADDDRLRDATAASELALVAAYRDALGRAPQLSDSLSQFLAHHLAHLARIAPGVSPDMSTKPLATASAAPSPGASALVPSTSPTPVDLAGLLAGLTGAEQQARRQRVAACDDAESDELAHELAVIAASEAQHAAALADLAAEVAR